MTQGPAISPSGLPVPNSTGMCELRLRVKQRVIAQFPLTNRCGNKRSEQRMGLERLRLELRMELTAEVPGMLLQLADLDVHPVRRLPGELQAVFRQHRLELAVELIAM